VPSAADIICLLDDEPPVLKAVGRLLASEGLRAEKFTDPTCFLDYARSHPVRLAVIDIRMPGMTGIEVLAELRAVSPGARAILMTGESDSAHRTAAMAGGARAFFLKPFDDELFLQAVREAIEPAV
jgi:FixJ family two-component response regulator